MLNWIESLPVELVGTHILGHLAIKDIIRLERACGSKKSHQLFLDLIPHCPEIALPSSTDRSKFVWNWFAKTKCRIRCLTILLIAHYNPCLHVKILRVDDLHLQLSANTTIENLKPLLDNDIGYKVRSITFSGSQNMEVMEELSGCTGNVKQLTIRYSDNCIDCLTPEILSRWKLTDINIYGSTIPQSLIFVIAQTCSELTSIKLRSDHINDSAVIAIAQHCPKLEKLVLCSILVTSTAYIALSERGLPLEELDLAYIPNIPTDDIARRCSHAFSCIQYLDINNFHCRHDIKVVISYMTGLTSVRLDDYYRSYIPLLTQYCHKLTKIRVFSTDQLIDVVLPLCRTNPLLQELTCYNRCGLADTTLIELIHACPHLHILDVPYETDITDTGILALSKHCPQLQLLTINRCHQVTETAVLQLLQCCRKLSTLYVSRGSLSEETWTQLDSNAQKRVRRW